MSIVRGSRPVAGCLVLLAVATMVAGCTSGPPDPTPTAQALAAALGNRDVAGVGFAGQSATSVQQDVDEALAGMSPATLDAVVIEAIVDESGAEPVAVATLGLTWDLDGAGPGTQTWSYSSDAVLAARNQPDEEYWQVRWNRSVLHPDLVDTSVLRLARTQAARADIIGAGGTTLVTVRPVERIGIDRFRLKGADPEPSARALAELVGIDPDAYVERVEAAGDEAFVEAIVLRESEAAGLLGAVEGIDGARAVAGGLSLAPTRDFARPLLGSVGPATAEIVETSEGAVAATDVVGLSGLQARYDEQLRGLPGYTVDAVRDDGAVRDELFTTPPTSGEALVLTLDLPTQQIADDLLAEVDSPSALVAMRAGTGELVAVASGPGGNGYSTATLGQYAPGSIFKIVSALGLLKAGETPRTPLPCTESVTIDGKPFTNYSDYPPGALGDIALETAFAQSCNTAFISQVDVLDWAGVRDAAASLGITASDDEAADLGFDAFIGSLADPDSRVEQAAGLIGQGTVLMSPLGAATMAASASVDTVRPALVEIDPATEREPISVAPEENDQIMSMMRLAVTDGTAQVLADVPGEPAAAKTGTAEFGAKTPPDTHGWMVAVQGDLAVAVFVEQAESGSSTAGPILREFLGEVGSTFSVGPAESQ